MEADKLKKKKGTINKGKVKKTLKNVICRPDPIFWPVVSEAEANQLENALKKHSVVISDFKKPRWNKLKSIPKSERPKPPPIEYDRKIDGLLFGISICRKFIQHGHCSAVLLEALVEPQTIVQPILEACASSDIPVLCLKDLRILSKNCFGIHTSCLSIKKDYLIQLSNIIKEISKNYNSKFKDSNYCNQTSFLNVSLVESNLEIEKEDSLMDIDTPSVNPYLFRTDKKSRVFVPNNTQLQNKREQFDGQHFIKLSEETTKPTDRKAYMNMILKKISSNPNRIKLK